MSSAEKRDRKRRNLLAIGAIFVLIICLTFLQTYLQGIGQTTPLGSNILIFALVNLNIILIMVLVLLVMRNLVKLYFERRRQILGAKFRTRLVLAFVALSIVPALILFFVSLKLITGSIQRWFDIQLEEALRSSSEIANLYYRDMEEGARHRARTLAEEITGQRLLESYNRDLLQAFLRKKEKEHRLAAIEVYTVPDEAELVLVNAGLPLENVPPLGRASVASALGGAPGVELQSTAGWDLFRASWPVRDGRGGDIIGVVVANHLVPESQREKIRAATRTFAEYQQLKLFRRPIQLSYKMHLIMIALLITFSATWFAFYLARSITTPIQKLAEGTRSVAGGNLDFEIATEASDEIGLLVSSFNRMTRDLRGNKAALEAAYANLKKSNLELEQRRNVIETILENIFSGVLSLDTDGNITTLNHAAEKMLNLPAAAAVGRHYREALAGDALRPAAEAIDRVLQADADTWEDKISLSHGNTARTLVISAAGLMDEERRNLGHLVVFEDLTQLVKAQRLAAWREVARRIAHEIKNPLTPIQLSIQRARKKYLEHSPDYRQVFLDATETITKQVNELKRLLDEFSRFARLPSVDPAPVDIHELIEDVLKLYEHRPGISFVRSYHPAPLVVNADSEQIRRVLINLLENALEAVEGDGEISFTTSLDPEETTARLRVADTGRGLPAGGRDRLFLPYFSTRKGGTGLGLAIVADIVSEHRGEIRYEDNVPQGAVFIIELPLAGAPAGQPRARETAEHGA